MVQFGQLIDCSSVKKSEYSRVYDRDLIKKLLKYRICIAPYSVFTECATVHCISKLYTK